ncbi:MAG: curli production assembly protein CsgF [Candidatus Nitronauta litoralis]|uniref:Curli production assembly/transport component CsgF n=1 Tax=Candidatus Nitronauta litoralis TaxID=2705533 RepID=A0A7T0BV37_9BACT|nr:MAG: curli production assembly protein CsgF [Candidatus Nitronauta litoralis]
MKRTIQKTILGMLAVGFFSTQVWAGEIVYTPVNPNFGGSPFNGAYLLSNAGQQNGFEAPPRDARDSAADFVERLDRTILSRLSRALTSDIIAEDGSINTGEFSTGVNTIVVSQSGGATVVTVTNLITGETTNITIPIVP